MQVKAKQVDRAVGSGVWGGILMTVYLASDGFTASFQSRLFKGYKMTVYNQILYTTAVSAAYSIIGASKHDPMTPPPSLSPPPSH